MAYHGKYLYTTKVIGMYSTDLELSVYGIFNTQKVHWEYYVISHYTAKTGNIFLTDDVGTSVSGNTISVDIIKRCGRLVPNVEEGKKFCDEFKMKWDSGSNNTTAEMRDKKLDEILDQTK